MFYLLTYLLTLTCTPTSFLYVEGKGGGDAGETTMLQSPYVEQSAHACLEFWYSIAHDGGVSKLTIQEEGGGGLRTQSNIWELKATDPESDGHWQVGQALVNANNLVVIAEKGEKEEGFAAIDDIFFKIDPEILNHCDTVPTSVSLQSFLIEITYFSGKPRGYNLTTSKHNTLSKSYSRMRL